MWCHFYIHWCGCNKKRCSKCGWGCGEIEMSCVATGNIRWCNCFAENLALHQDTKYKVTVWSSNSTGLNTQKKWKHVCTQKLVYRKVRRRIFHNSQKMEATKMSHQLMNGCVKWNIIQPKKGAEYWCIMLQTDEPGKHCAVWTKPITKGHVWPQKRLNFLSFPFLFFLFRHAAGQASNLRQSSDLSHCRQCQILSASRELKPQKAFQWNVQNRQIQRDKID